MEIYVTKPSLPDLNVLIPHLQEIWSSKQLTNFGHYYQAFQEKFAEQFSTSAPILTSSGNSALNVSCCALYSKGEVITTPYSFVATSNVIISSGCKPVYADICPDTFSITADTVEKLITENTTGILATHCYGIPGDIDGLSALSRKYSLPLIYDCAHGIGVKYHGKALCSYGDVSCLSFHATKLFNTFEGGAIISSDPIVQSRVKKLTNFGIVDEFDCDEVGTNGKMNELAAAIGLVTLPYVDSWINRRREIYLSYLCRLSALSGVDVPKISAEDHNYSYMPVLFRNNQMRENAIEKLRENGIIARRYFYPIIPLLSAYEKYKMSAQKTPVALDISNRVLCLPIYPDLGAETVDFICCILEGLS